LAAWAPSWGCAIAHRCCGLGRAALVGLDVDIRFTATAAELSLDATSAREQGRQRRERAS
jgi:hypothetical protein